MNLPVLKTDNISFPDPNSALTDPNGLLAIGGDLSPDRLINAYKNGIFPWYSEGEPILWWSPDPRAVLFLDDLIVSSRLKRFIKNCNFNITFNEAFKEVVEECSKPRPKQPETWITPEMQEAYIELFKLGHAMSAEVWQENKLIGGIYGVLVNKIFCGESMFSRESNASKVALIYLANYLKDKDFKLIDCQIMNPHLESLGAKEIPRKDFLKLLKNKA